MEPAMSMVDTAVNSPRSYPFSLYEAEITLKYEVAFGTVRMMEHNRLFNQY